MKRAGVIALCLLAWGAQGMSLHGHKGWVSAIAFSPDGVRLASGGDDNALRIWDSRSGQLLMSLELNAAITALAFSPDGNELAVGTWEGELQVRSSQTGEPRKTWLAHGETITRLAYTPDGSRIASGSGDDSLKIWDTDGKELLALLHDNEYDVTALAFSPDGEQIVSGDGESHLIVWDAKSGNELMTLEGHRAAIAAVAFSPDGKQILSGSWDNTLMLWDASSGQPLQTLSGHTDHITAVAFSPDGRRIASASEDKTLRFWEAASGKPLRTLAHSSPLTDLAFSSDDKVVAAGHTRISIWDDGALFLEQNCMKCHGPDKQKGQIRFDQVGGFRSEDRNLWTMIHEQVASGDMPPEDEPQPSDAERDAILGWIEQNLRKYGAPQTRRLNRRELSGALQDITGLDIDFAAALPGDGKVNGFDTGAAGLQDAADSVDQIMLVTQRAVAAIRFLEPAPGPTLTASFRNLKDPRKGLDSWKKHGITPKVRGFGRPDGLLIPPKWLGDRDGEFFSVPPPPGEKGVLRLKATVSSYLPLMLGIPDPILWVDAGGKVLEYRELNSAKPIVLEYLVQFEDAPITERGLKIGLQPKVEMPYAVDGFDNEDRTKKEDKIPGGPGLFRPKWDKKLIKDPDEQPIPFLMLHELEIDPNYVAAWPPSSWELKLGELGDNLESASRLLDIWIHRAWRRPVAAEEQAEFISFYQQLRADGLSFDAALRATFQSVLMSGPFRYLGSPADSQHALASRLSFMLWAAPPDATLRDLASAGKLADSAVLDAQVDRLLADPRSDAFVRPFVTQWLEMEQPITVVMDYFQKQDFRFGRYLKESMREETYSYIARMFADNRPASELIDSDWTMMNNSLTRHYGYEKVEGGRLRKVALRADDPRGGGILAHAGIQSMLCWMGDNWVIYRGAWTLRHILDDPPPLPPLEVPELDPNAGSNRGKPMRELLHQHQEEPNCAVCHRDMDPLGFAYQNFDLAGRWRDVEHEKYHVETLDGKIAWRGVGKTRPVDSAGRMPRGEEFADFASYKQVMMTHYQDDLVRGLLKNLMLYASGRQADVDGLSEIRDIMNQQKSKGYPLRDLLKAVLRTEAVRGQGLTP